MTDQSPELPYVQIAEAIREQIETGRLKPGDKLPSNRALMEKYGAGTQTVQRAMRALKDAGYVESRASRGVFVRERPKSVERSATYTNAPKGGKINYNQKQMSRTVGPVAAAPYIAEQLGVPDGTTVICRSRLMGREGKPVELVSSFYPMDIADGTELAADRGLKGGSPAALERLGFDGVRTTEWVYTRLPLPGEIKALGIRPEQPVFRLLRTVFDADDRPVEVLEMVMSGDSNVLRYDL